MIHRPISAITKADIEALVEDEVGERRTLEYKAELPGGRDAEKKEFLADVSSFANADGGDIIYGIVDRRDGVGQPTGVPQDACGVALDNADAEIRRMEQLLRQSLSPVVENIEFAAIPGFQRGPVVVVRIPQSHLRPHMVSFKNSSRFFGRTSAGKYQLDVSELRSAFAETESLPQRLRAFRDARVKMIRSGWCPVPMDDSAKVVWHLIPFASMQQAAAVNPNTVETYQTKLKPMASSSWNYRYNVDGFLTYHERRASPSRSYVQVFRNGAVEAVRSGFTEEHKGRMTVASVAYEKELIAVTRNILGLFSDLGIRAPVAGFLSLLGVRGAVMASRPRWEDDDEITAFDRDLVTLPDVLIRDIDAKPEACLRPLFDAVWQSAGMALCPHYDEVGNRTR